jgi:hypothetical protein
MTIRRRELATYFTVVAETVLAPLLSSGVKAAVSTLHEVNSKGHPSHNNGPCKRGVRKVTEYLAVRFFLRCLLFLSPHLTHSLGSGFPLYRREIPFLLGWCFDRCGRSIAGDPYGRHSILWWPSPSFHSALQHCNSRVELVTFSYQESNDLVSWHSTDDIRNGAAASH